MAIATLDMGLVKTAAFNGTSLDISGITGDVTVFIRVESLTAAKNVLMQVQDSVDAFANNRVVMSVGFTGAINTGSDVVVSQRLYQDKMFRAGTASAVARLVVAAIDGSATVQYSGWLQY